MQEAPEYFICYSRAQRELAAKIEAKLRSRIRRGELRLWRDERRLDAWEAFTPEISEVLAHVAGAIVIVSDDWYDSDYIHEHEWPRIADRANREVDFGVFALSFHSLDEDDPLRERNFVNDPSEERLVGCSDELRDTVLTRLGNQVGGHAKRIRPQNVAVDRAEELVEATTGDRSPAAIDLRDPAHIVLDHVPGLPKGFVPPDNLDWLCETIGSATSVGLTGLQGEGGTGKTVLAAAIALRLAPQFSAGVHWVTVGEKANPEDVRRLQSDLLHSLHASPGRVVRDFNDGRELLANALSSRRALVIVDDVWEPWQAIAFDAANLGGGPSTVLFTSRFADALPRGVSVTQISRLEGRAAAAFLERLPAGLPAGPGDLAAVIDVAGGLRLALAVLSATATIEGGWAAVVARLGGLSERFGRGDDASAAQKAAHVAMQSLSEENRQRLLTLARFPEDATIPIDLLSWLWSTDASSVVEHLRDGQLVTVHEEGIEVHDHLHDHLVLAAPASDVHERVWQRSMDIVADQGWATLARSHPYLWNRLIWHGCRAKIRRTTLVRTATDLTRLAQRVRANGAPAAQADLDIVCAATGESPDSPIGRLARVLRHGLVFDVAGANDGLEVSLRLWESAIGASPEGAPPRFVGELQVPSAALHRTLAGHRDSVVDVSFNGDGTLLATGSADGTARIWDPLKGQTVHTFAEHTSWVWAVAFSHDGTLLATASDDRTARISRTSTGESLRVLTEHAQTVTDVVFAPAGDLLATASCDNTARLWDTTTWRTLHVLAGHGAWVWAVAFNHDGTLVATAGDDGTARIWDTRTGQLTAVLTGHTDNVRAVAFAADGSRVGTASYDGTARIWDSSSGQLIRTLEGHADWVRAVSFHPTDNTLATASSDGTIRVWDGDTGATQRILTGHTNWVRGATYTSDGKLLATASYDGTARIWNPSKGEARHAMRGHTSWVRGIAYDPSGSLIATGSADNTVRLWDAQSGEQLQSFAGHGDWVWGVRFNKTGTLLASGGDDGTARIWDLANNELMHTLAGHSEKVRAVAFNEAGTLLATAGYDGVTRLWDPSTGEPVAGVFRHADRVGGVAFDRAGKRLVTTGADSVARVWDVATGDLALELVGHEGWVLTAAFSDDDALLATASADGTARLWDAVTGQAMRTFAGHSNWVPGLGFLDGSRRLATAGDDGTARIWDTSTGACILTLALGCSGALASSARQLALATGPSWIAIDLASLELSDLRALSARDQFFHD